MMNWLEFFPHSMMWWLDSSFVWKIITFRREISFWMKPVSLSFLVFLLEFINIIYNRKNILLVVKVHSTLYNTYVGKFQLFFIRFLFISFFSTPIFAPFQNISPLIFLLFYFFACVLEKLRHHFLKHFLPLKIGTKKKKK